MTAPVSSAVTPEIVPTGVCANTGRLIEQTIANRITLSNGQSCVTRLIYQVPFCGLPVNCLNKAKLGNCDSSLIVVSRGFRPMFLKFLLFRIVTMLNHLTLFFGFSRANTGCAAAGMCSILPQFAARSSADRRQISQILLPSGCQSASGTTRCRSSRDTVSRVHTRPPGQRGPKKTALDSPQ